MRSIRESNLKELSPMSSVKDSSPKLKNIFIKGTDTTLGYSVSRNGVTLNKIVSDSTIKTPEGVKELSIQQNKCVAMILEENLKPVSVVEVEDIDGNSSPTSNLMITPSVTGPGDYSSYRPSMNLNLKEEKSTGNLNNYFSQGTTSDVLRSKALNANVGHQPRSISTGPDLIDQRQASQAKRASSASRNPFMLIPPSGAIFAKEQKGLQDQIR